MFCLFLGSIFSIIYNKRSISTIISKTILKYHIPFLILFNYFTKVCSKNEPYFQIYEEKLGKLSFSHFGPEGKKMPQQLMGLKKQCLLIKNQVHTRFDTYNIYLESTCSYYYCRLR